MRTQRPTLGDRGARKVAMALAWFGTFGLFVGLGLLGALAPTFARSAQVSGTTASPSPRSEQRAPSSEQQARAAFPALIPRPQDIVLSDEPSGAGFAFTPNTRMSVDLRFPSNLRVDVLAVVERQAAELRTVMGYPLSVVAEAEDGTVQVLYRAEMANEAYRIDSSADHLTVESGSEAGVFYAFQTLRQLLPRPIPGASNSPTWLVPALVIDDAPRFPYRGLHLDVGRHFFSAQFIETMLDTMARFKFNRFHWHLTEDQGWRIPIDAYPRLTEVGAWRDETQIPKSRPPRGDGQRYGGHYTKDEIRRVVAFARERQITVIPEIEMPGHASAAIASYPQFGCDDRPKSKEEPARVGTTWGVHQTIFCPKEETFQFLEHVLDQVIDLFPSELIHIGGDEVAKRHWRESPLAQAVMRRENLASEAELQAWFVRRIGEYLSSKGRRLIGWDEIIEGGLPPSATVMTWRSEKSAVVAASAGHDVIRTPIEHSYLDFSQGDPANEPPANNWAGFPLTLRRVYEFEPVPAELEVSARRHIVGGQGNLWTELIATPDHAEYMLYPRALALAEVLWSPKDNRDWADFSARLSYGIDQLESLGVNFRWPVEVLGAPQTNLESLPP